MTEDKYEHSLMVRIDGDALDTLISQRAYEERITGKRPDFYDLVKRAVLHQFGADPPPR